MTEGAILKNFIENRRESKQKIADALGMTRSNLYQLFESKVLSDDTKKKFEKHFKIKWKDIDTVQLDRSLSSKDHPSPERTRIGDDNSDENKTTMVSLAKGMELAEQARLIEAESRKIEAENRKEEISNMRRLIHILEIRMGIPSAGFDFPEPGTPGTKTYPVKKDEEIKEANLDG